MISLFDQELRAMQEELRDLKTIHERGLGTTQFYSYEREITIPSGYYMWYLEAEVENTNLLPMVVLPFIEGPTVINFVMGFTSNSVVVSSLATQGTVTVRLFSSSEISNITTWVESW